MAIPTTRAYFIPGWGYINETKTISYFVPGWGYINQTVVVHTYKHVHGHAG